MASDLTGRIVRDVAVVVLVHLVVACVIGLLVPQVADLSQATRTTDGVVSSEAEIVKQFNDDGWLIVLGGLAGLVLGLVLQLWRRTHEAVTLLAIVVSSLVGAVLAGRIAEATGPDDPVTVLADATVGATASMQVVIDSQVAYVVWPLTAVLGALTALLAPPSSRHDRAPAETTSDVTHV